MPRALAQAAGELVGSPLPVDSDTDPAGVQVAGRSVGVLDEVTPGHALVLGLLGAKSLTVTWGALGVYVADPIDRGRRADSLWNMIESGKLKIEINQRYALADIKQAHIDLEGRKTTGSSVIVP